MLNSDNNIYNELLYFAQVFICSYTTIHNCYYLLLLCKTEVKTKNYWQTNNTNINKNDELKKAGIKNRKCYYVNEKK